MNKDRCDKPKGTPDLSLRWNPYMNYVCTMPQIQEWFDSFGEFAFYGGQSWNLVHKKLCPGRYLVRFQLHEF